jgi:ORF6N domain
MGQQVMLDKDIPSLYEVKPFRLRKQVQRNIERFPEDFMFQLTETEVDFMVSQNAIPSRKHLARLKTKTTRNSRSFLTRSGNS